MPPQNAAFTTNCSGLKSSFCMAMIGNAVPHAMAAPCICCFVATFLDINIVMPLPTNGPSTLDTSGRLQPRPSCSRNRSRIPGRGAFARRSCTVLIKSSFHQNHRRVITEREREREGTKNVSTRLPKGSTKRLQKKGINSLSRKNQSRSEMRVLSAALKSIFSNFIHKRSKTKEFFAHVLLF